MKHVKMLGLAAVAAMALMAVVGASTASATVLCETNITSGCSGAWDVPEKTNLVFSLEPGTTATLRDTANFLNDTCTSSGVSGPTANTGSATETVKGTVEAKNLTWGGCTQITNTIAGGTLEIHHIAGTDSGTVTASGFKVTIFLAGLSCIYEAKGIDIGTLTEGKTGTATPPTMDVNAVVTSPTFGCPSTSKWEAAYIMTEPKNTTVGVAAS